MLLKLDPATNKWVELCAVSLDLYHFFTVSVLKVTAMDDSIIVVMEYQITGGYKHSFVVFKKVTSERGDVSASYFNFIEGAKENES